MISEAYVSARRPPDDAGNPDLVNEIIALRILVLARQGVRDPNRLRAGALATPPVPPSSIEAAWKGERDDKIDHR